MQINKIVFSALLVAGAGVSGVATASAVSKSSAPKVIYACAAKQNGAVRLVSKPSQCTTKETSVSWNRTGLRGAQGAKGAKGAQGVPGAPGTPGPSGIAGVQYIVQLFDLPANSSLLADVTCPGGTIPIGGGAHFGNTFFGGGRAGEAYVSEEDIDDSDTGWAATLVNDYSSGAQFTADAVCATTSS